MYPFVLSNYQNVLQNQLYATCLPEAKVHSSGPTTTGSTTTGSSANFENNKPLTF